MVIASSIAAIGVAFLIFLMIYSAKFDAILIPQMSRQTQASRAMQQITESLRNAKFSTIVIYQSGAPVTSNGDRIDFQSLALPAGQTASVRFSGSTLTYYPNINNLSDSAVLARNLDSATFSNTGQMIQITVVFKYRQYRGYNQTEAERFNGTFETRVFPRNS